MPTDYLQVTNAILQGYTIHNSSYLMSLSKAVYYLILVGSTCGLALFVLTFFAWVQVTIFFKCTEFTSGQLTFILLSCIVYTVSFRTSSTIAILGSLLLAPGAALWTVIMDIIESREILPNPEPGGSLQVII
jgi:hypothetical protein